MKSLKLTLIGLFLLLAFPLAAQTTILVSDQTGEISKETLSTLAAFIELQTNLGIDISALNERLKAAPSDAEKDRIKARLIKLQTDLETTSVNFENIAAGVDISLLREQKKKEFNIQREIFSLIRPAIDEMKEMTSSVRQKSELKEKIAYYNERLPIIKNALANVEKLSTTDENEIISDALNKTSENWTKQQAFMLTELQAAELQLNKIIASEVSLAESSQSRLKAFFQKRGLYLAEALLIIVTVIFLSRVSHRAMVRLIPGFRAEHRSFRVRLVELIHRVLTLLFTILGPMLVFYLEEDWVLFSLGILLLLGIAWALRQTLPRYWSQIQLFLNIGSVREGERLALEGLPWLVERINVHSTLTNPIAGISQRIPIEELVDLRSRPCQKDEPWFPCTKGDWVILGDGSRGKVTGISHELVQLVARGGARLTYETSQFLSLSPKNLSTNFRIKEFIGISYSHQKESTQEIPKLLQAYLFERAKQEGYGEQLLALKVEFSKANESSLDLVVIADFSGELGDLYNRLRRAIQRWSVEACNQYAWEIPFPQMVIHTDKPGDTQTVEN